MYLAYRFEQRLRDQNDIEQLYMPLDLETPEASGLENEEQGPDATLNNAFIPPHTHNVWDAR